MRLLDRVLDRQAVAVPARHVVRVEAGQLARLDDHVLQHLVDGVADVDLAVGIRRAVVQHEQRRAVARVAQPLVDALFVPGLDPARLALGQVAAHRERRVGQVQRGAVVGRGRRAGGVGAWRLSAMAMRSARRVARRSRDRRGCGAGERRGPGSRRCARPASTARQIRSRVVWRPVCGVRWRRRPERRARRRRPARSPPSAPSSPS